ncbi:MAG: GIY-YIG nuclease family protein [bacterium]
MPYVYILKNQNGRFYIGSTMNLELRMRQHLSGQTISTRRMGVLEMVFYQEYKNLKVARKIEYKLKNLKRHDYIASIVEDGFIKMKP